MKQFAWLVAAGVALGSLATPAVAADKFTIGYVGTFSGPGGVTGGDSHEGLELGLEELHNTIGGLPVNLIMEDDQQKPDLARQIVDKFVKSDHVNVIVAATFSNILLAIAGPVVKSETVMISAVAGPSQIAGKDCSQYIFDTSWQGDNFAEAMGTYLQASGKQNLYVMAPNYAAGHDVVNGLKRFYKGSIAGEVFTPLTQLDFSAELAQIRATNPAGVFVFYPGGLGVQFVKQYAQAGLMNKIPLYTAYTIDNSTLRGIGDDALGLLGATSWTADLDNPANKRFVADFRKKFGHMPAETAAQAYDTINLLDSAVRQLHGKLDDKQAFIAALKAAKFTSVKGDFRFANDHFPILNFYLTKVQKDADGQLEINRVDTVLKNYGNAYAAECPLK